MVVFVCTQCNVTLKKSGAQNHLKSSRRCSMVSCVDCHKDFDKFSIASHCVCISEKEKYDKLNYLKSSKGDKNSKQAEWVSKVENAIQNCQSKRLKFFLQNLKGNFNVPKKKKKFENFMRSKYRGIPGEVVEEMWKILEPLKLEITSNVSSNSEKDFPHESLKDESKPKKQKLEEKCDFLSRDYVLNILSELGGSALFSDVRRKIYKTYTIDIHSSQECMTKKEFKTKLLDVIQSSECFTFSPSSGMISISSDDLRTQSNSCSNQNANISPSKGFDTLSHQNDKTHDRKSIKRLLIPIIHDAGGRISVKKLVKKVSLHILSSNDQKETNANKDELKSKIMNKVSRSHSMKLSDDRKYVELCS
ncbi:Cell growth-regulating nucleolar protein [Schistosoma japonicum]|uniref:Cell growth-regulating nucleolar protein n=1 Tax=Schistosoma japonicum TaxID=6182 RepID=A0A4Z2CVK5_SCHJA|nr:Cell growth-regulating nucleolar protein [Schistosoma japonicum]